ncbi:MAG: hypothetical protein ACLP2Y_15090 [Limisphaerales bacterium]
MIWRYAIWLIFVIPGLTFASLNCWLAFIRPAILKTRKVKTGFVSPLPIIGSLLLFVSLTALALLKIKPPKEFLCLIIAAMFVDLLSLLLVGSIHNWSQPD